MNSKQLKYAEIFSFLALFFLIMFIFFNDKINAYLEECKQDNMNIQEQSNIVKGKNEDLQRNIQIVKGENKNLKEKFDDCFESDSYRGTYPPNITIENTGEYAFPLGQAKLTPALEYFISGEIVEKIKETFDNYPVNAIEVIGHTDGVEISANSNLDKLLSQVANDNKKIEKLRAGSNADLGLMRALAVIKALQQEEELLELFEDEGIDQKKVFRAYSAAQLYLPDGTIAPPESDANEDKSRRRIEIRFTQLKYQNKN